METVCNGAALVLQHNIDTDQIYPGRFLELTDPKEIGSRCLSGVREEIAASFEQGGIVVAGRNFGCGSSREHAAIALLNMGASVVIAESFARIFYRNCINLGLPLLVCKNLYAEVLDGERLTVDLKSGVITSADSGRSWTAEPLGDYAMSILEAGGIKPLFRKRFEKI